MFFEDICELQHVNKKKIPPKKKLRGDEWMIKLRAVDAVISHGLLSSLRRDDW